MRFEDVLGSPLGRKTVETFARWLAEHRKPVRDVVEAYRIIVERFDRETRRCIASEEGCEPLYPPAYPLVEKAFAEYLRRVRC